jgi:hypothetical protein
MRFMHGAVEKERRGASGVPAPRQGSGRPEQESKGASDRAGVWGQSPTLSWLTDSIFESSALHAILANACLLGSPSVG